MSEKRSHPGATGVGDPLEWRLGPKREQALAQGFRHLCGDEVAWVGFKADVEGAVRYYIQMKEVAERSSAGSIRHNLKAALVPAERLRKRLDELDGNSLQLLRHFLRQRDAKREIGELIAGLAAALQLADERFPPRGPRPRSERVQTAALILRALRKHTDVQPVATEGKPFELLLKLSFGFAREKRRDLHGLARRALAEAVTIEEGAGLLTVGAPNDE